MARYIDVEKIELKGLAIFDDNLDILVPLSDVRKALQMTPTAKIIPCKIGDIVWAIREYKGTKIAQQGIVSEMFYVGKNMELCIVVKHISRGYWGKTVFATQEEAQAVINERK